VVPVNYTNTSHDVVQGFLSVEESEHIARVLKRSERDVLRLPNPEWNDSNYPPLTKQHVVYNWLTHPDIRPLNIPQRLLGLDLFKDINNLTLQCWGNILRQGEHITPHQHHEEDKEPLSNFHKDTTPQERAKTQLVPMVATNIFLDGVEPSYTHYEDTKQTRNIKGDLHIVGAYHRHEVKTNVYRTPRYSLAMDIYFRDYTKGWDTIEKGFSNTKRFVDVSRSNV